MQVVSILMDRQRTNQSLGFVLASREDDVTVVDDVFTGGLAALAGLRYELRVVVVFFFSNSWTLLLGGGDCLTPAKLSQLVYFRSSEQCPLSNSYFAF